MSAATRRQAPVLPVGTYWCAVASYADGSGLLGIYGPYPTSAAANEAADQLREAGVHRDHSWETQPLRLIDLGATSD